MNKYHGKFIIEDSGTISKRKHLLGLFYELGLDITKTWVVLDENYQSHFDNDFNENQWHSIEEIYVKIKNSKIDKINFTEQDLMDTLNFLDKTNLEEYRKNALNYPEEKCFACGKSNRNDQNYSITCKETGEQVYACIDHADFYSTTNKSVNCYN